MIKTQKLRFQYTKAAPSFVLPDINLESQEHLLILGKSGVGKTTYLKLLAGLLTPNAGKVIINGVNISKLSAAKLDAFRGKHIGIVFQKKHAIQSLNVIENLKARLFFSKVSSTETALEDLLNTLDLSAQKYSAIQTLSEGQLQRLGIAMAVVHQPKLILADEPTSSLDDENSKRVMQLLQDQAQRTKANLVVITHDARVKPFFKNTLVL